MSSKHKIMTGIYKITSPTNRIYIGQSVDIYEMRINMSKAQKLRVLLGYENNMKGKKHSEETKNKIREKALGRKGLSGNKNPMFGKTGYLHPKSKVVFDTSNGVFYDSIKEASFYKGINYSVLRDYFNGRLNNKSGLVLS